MAESDYVQVITTAGSAEEADRLSAGLVERNLAACVQVSGPITSRYRWRGELEVDEEWWCVAKSERRLFPEIERAIEEIHSYDEPEIVAVPVAEGSAGYLGWISEQLHGAR